MDHNIKSELTADGILIARIDMPGRSMNVFSLDMMDSLERLLIHVEGSDLIRAVVLTSGKREFLAGADLDMILGVFTERAKSDTHEQLHEFCGRLGRLFLRLEKSEKPYVAAINGLALGGGLEVCLSCHARIVADDNRILLGLPEIKLGLLPGAGGTQRLPRLVGAEEGLRLLLTGDPLSPQKALALGVVDGIAAPDELVNVALERARTMGKCVSAWDKPGAQFVSKPFDFSKDTALDQIAETFSLSQSLLDKYPAYRAIMNCVVGGWNMPMDKAGEWEMDCFVRLIQDPVAGNMVRTLFINRQRADKLAPVSLNPRTTKVAVAGDGGSRVQTLLEKGKANVVEATALSGQDVVLVMPDAKADKGIQIAWIADVDTPQIPESARATVWLSEQTSLGRSLEVSISKPDADARDAGIVLGKWLRSTVLVTHGSRLLLPRLFSVQSSARKAGCSEEDELLAISLVAADAWSEGGIEDTELADVGAVIAGIFPAYAGGPFNYIRQRGLENLISRAASASAHDEKLFNVPVTLAALCEKLSIRVEQ